MKRLLTILALLVSVSVFGQIGRLPYKTLMQTYRGDTCKTTVESDTVHYYTDLDVFDFNKPITINGASPFSNFWMQTGSDIYFNTGNVGIGNDAPAYTLDVNGNINLKIPINDPSFRLFADNGKGGTIEYMAIADNAIIIDSSGWGVHFGIGKYPNYELDVNGSINANNFSTGSEIGSAIKIGSSAGISDASATNSNVYIGHSAGSTNIDGMYNIYIGRLAGEISTGSENVFIGHQSGGWNTTGSCNTFLNTQTTNTTGSYNTYIGIYSGNLNTTGSNNVAIGRNASDGNTIGNSNIIIGKEARFFGKSFSNELVMDNQKRGASGVDTLKYRSYSLIYGQFDSDTLNQFVDINGRLRHTATTAEIYRHVDSTARTQSIPNGTTPTKIVVFSDNGVSSHCTADAANDKITITKPGIYDVKLFISYSSSINNVNWFARLFLGGSAAPNIHSQGNTSSANQFRSTALGGKIRVTTVPIDLDYRVFHDYGSAVNLTFISANLNVNYIGE